MGREIIVITSSGSGHLFPCLELCNLICRHNYEATLVLPSDVSASIPSSFLQNPLFRCKPISPVPLSSPQGSGWARERAQLDLEAHLSAGVLCAVVDFQMGWTKHALLKFDIPIVSFFTFGACAASMELGAWKARVRDLVTSPGDTHVLPDLPPEVRLSYSDLQRSGGRVGGPVLGEIPPWVSAVEGSVGLMFNTCQALEHTFLDYMSREIGLPLWAVGPLLPAEFWSPPRPRNSFIRDRETRSLDSDVLATEEEAVIRWLDLQQRGSVLYVSFGSMLSPAAEDCLVLAQALESSATPFIWADPSGNGPRLAGERGMVIRGWAPQLLILSHPSTGGFLSHCGWNSTVEAIGLGVPILGWPIRGDQFLNAKLVVGFHRVGHMAHEKVVTREDLMLRIQRFMGDDGEVKRRAKAVKAMFDSGFPRTSEAAIYDFIHFIESRQA